MNKRYIILFILIAISSHAIAQRRERIDSLKKVLRVTAGKEMVSVLNALAWEYRLAYPDSTIHFAKKAFDHSQALASEGESAKALNFMGLAYDYKGDYKNSFLHFNQALEYAEQYSDTEQKGHAYNSLGRLFFNQGDQIKSYDFFYKALDIFRSIDDQAGAAYVYRSLADLYEIQGETRRAREMMGGALEIRRQIRDERGQISVLLELSDSYLVEQKYKEAFQYLEEAAEIAEDIRDQVSMAEIYLGIGEVYHYLENYIQANEYSKRALRIAETGDNQKLFTSIYLSLGANYYCLEAYDKATDYFREVIAFTESSEDLHLEKEAYRFLHMTHQQQGDLESALTYLSRFIDANDRFYNAEKAKQIERLEARLALEQVEKENMLLKEQESKNQIIIEYQQLQNTTLVVVVSLMILFLGSLLMNNRKKKRAYQKLALQNERIQEQGEKIRQQKEEIEKQNKELRKGNEELAKLNKDKDNLMNIVAHDLKSPINQIKGLSELVKMTGALSEEQLKYMALMKEVSRTGSDLINDLLDLNAIQSETKAIKVQSLDPKILLEEKFEEYQSLASQKEIHVNLDCCKKGQFYSDKLLLSRILDNLISNAIKFSKPGTEVWIKGYINEGSELVMSIKDQGPGFTEEDRKKLFKKFQKLSARPTGGESSNGLGLAIVKSFVEKLQGRVQLVSEPGKGSEFILILPSLNGEAKPA